MEASELMIGDWVKIKDYPMKAKKKRMSPEYYTRSLVEFEPIPITREILIKNGFIPNDRLSLNSDYLVYDEIIISNKWYVSLQDDDWAIDFQTEYENTEISCVIKYVHELQHIMSSLKKIKINDFII